MLNVWRTFSNASESISASNGDSENSDKEPIAISKILIYPNNIVNALPVLSEKNIYITGSISRPMTMTYTILLSKLSNISYCNNDAEAIKITVEVRKGKIKINNVINKFPNLEDICDIISKEARCLENWLFSSWKKIRLLDNSWNIKENINTSIGLLILDSIFSIIKNNNTVNTKDVLSDAICDRSLNNATSSQKDFHY